MSEVRGYKTLTLGRTENLFLILFCIAAVPASASLLFNLLKEEKTSMAYKNVHKRVDRLFTLGLIKKFKEKHGDRWKHNAIRYEITDFGIFQRLMIVFPHQVTVAPLIRHKNSIVLQNLLYRHFESETVVKFSLANRAQLFLARYLKKCCEGIIDIAEKGQGDLSSEAFEVLIFGHIDNEAKDLARNLVFEASYEDQFLPIDFLKRDKKFMSLLQEVKKDFDNYQLGYQKFIS